MLNNPMFFFKKLAPCALLIIIIQLQIVVSEANEAPDYVVSDATHIFALDPFEIDQITPHASIEDILAKFGLPISIEIGNETQLQFSKYTPVNYTYSGYKFTFGFESFWTGYSENNELLYEPYKVLETVQAIAITSPDIKLRYDIHVGMQWEEVVRKLGNPYRNHTYHSSDSHTYRSNTIYYDIASPFKDAVFLQFEVNENGAVTNIFWPRDDKPD